MPKKQITVQDIEDLSIKDKFLELNELKLFLSISKEHGLSMDHLLFATLAYAGMRSGELLALKWSDTDFQKKMLRITKKYYNPNNNADYKFRSPTTKKSIRTIMIDEKLVALLKTHRLEQMEVKMKQRLVYTDQNFFLLRIQVIREISNHLLIA